MSDALGVFSIFSCYKNRSNEYLGCIMRLVFGGIPSRGDEAHWRTSWLTM